MGFFSIFNYEKYIINTVKNSSYSKKLLARLIISFVTFVIKLHLSALLYIFFNGNFFYDIIFPIITGVILSLIEDNIYDILYVYKKTFYRLSKYIIQNYGRKNIMWKRIIIILLSIYIIFVLMFIEVNNSLIILITVQNLLEFLIVDIINNYNNIKNYIEIEVLKPKITRNETNKTMNEFVIDDYIKNDELKDWVFE